MSEKKRSLLRKMKLNQETLQTILQNTYQGDDIFTNVLNKLLNGVKIFITSARKFIADDCFTKASSITYAIILSLVPALTVALTIYTMYYGGGENKKELFDKILQLMADYNIKVNIDPVFDLLHIIIDNAGKIGGISAVFIVFSATAMLRSLEKSFNSIWNVEKGRPVLLKTVYYWAALTLGPVLLAAGMTVATLFSSILTSPDYNSAYLTKEQKLWIVGDRGTILLSDASKSSFINIGPESERIDFDNQKIYKYRSASKTFVEQEYRIEPAELENASLEDIQFTGNKGLIVGSDGFMLATGNNGLKWSVKKYDNLKFNDIYMINENTVFITTKNGKLLHTTDGGKTWDVKEWEGQLYFTGISFYKNKGIITGNRGTIIQTDDGGKTWELKQIAGAKRKKRHNALNGSFFINEKQIWLYGNNGTLLYSDDGGESWTPKWYKDYDYYSAFFINGDEGFISGSKGLLIETKDGGLSWETRNLHTMQINTLLYQNQRLWTIGDEGSIMASTDKGERWKTIQKGRSILYNLISFLGPFCIIWLVFLPAYITLPNIKIPFKAAALASTVTSAVWVVFILLFIVYVKNFSHGTVVLYGTFAAIPLILLMVYASSLIILFGAEMAYTLMYPETYRRFSKPFDGKKELSVYTGIAVLEFIYAKFEAGRGASSLTQIQRAVSGSPEEIDVYIRLYTREKLILRHEESWYMPASSSRLVPINTVIDLILRLRFDLPATAGNTPLKKILERLLKKISADAKKAAGNLTLKQVIETGRGSARPSARNK